MRNPFITSKGTLDKRDSKLRHTATSLMKNAGKSLAIVEEFLGHNSNEISRVYTHIDAESLERAAESLPDLVPPASS